MSESIWKKEISFRRAPKEPAPPKPESIWKKEITFRRKPKASTRFELPPALQAVLAGATLEPAAKQPPEESMQLAEVTVEEPPFTAEVHFDEEPVAVDPAPPLSVLAPFADTPAPPSWPEVQVEPSMDYAPPRSEVERFCEPPASELWPEEHVLLEPSPAEPWSTSEPEPFAEAVFEPWPAPAEPEELVSVEPPMPPLSVVEPVADRPAETREVPPLPPASPPWVEEHVLSEPSPLEPEPFAESVVEPWLSPAELPAAPEPEAKPIDVHVVPRLESKTSFWKKERSLRRKHKDTIAEDFVTPEVVVEPAVDAEPNMSFWKKERSLRRKHKDTSSEDVVALEPALVAEPMMSVVEPVPDRPAETREALPLAPASPPWADEHARAEPSQVEPEPFAEAVVEPWLSPAELPAVPEPEAHTSEEVFVEPVVAVQPAAHPEPKTAFWKKERSVRRKQKDADAEVFVEPVVALEPVAEAETSTSFWKKERSLRRKDRNATAEVVVAPPIAVEPAADAEPKTSFLRKERSLRRTPKAEAPERPQEHTVSFLRKEHSLKPRLPKREPRVKGPKGHDVKRYVGLKIGASQLAAARVANNGAAELLQLAREPLDAGVVVGGEVRDPEALAAALKKFFARNKLPRKHIRLGIASNRIGVRTFDVDGIADEKQLDNAIRFRAHEVLTIPLDEAVLDYHVVRESVGPDGVTSRRILLVVAYRELVERYVFACRKAGLTLAGIDLEAFALLRSLSPPRADDEPSGAALVAVSIGHDRSTFAVSDGRVCEFTRVIEWGGASLNIALARVLDLAPSEVEHVKRSLSLASTDVPEGMLPDRYALAVDAVRTQVQGFARELVASLQFYQGQPESLEIGEIVITGGTAGLDGLAGELENLVGVRVRVGDPLARLKVAKKVAADEHVGSLAVAIGLGIED